MVLCRREDGAEIEIGGQQHETIFGRLLKKRCVRSAAFAYLGPMNRTEFCVSKKSYPAWRQVHVDQELHLPLASSISRS